MRNRTTGLGYGTAGAISVVYSTARRKRRIFEGWARLHGLMQLLGALQLPSLFSCAHGSSAYTTTTTITSS